MALRHPITNDKEPLKEEIDTAKATLNSILNRIPSEEKKAAEIGNRIVKLKAEETSFIESKTQALKEFQEASDNLRKKNKEAEDLNNIVKEKKNELDKLTNDVNEVVNFKDNLDKKNEASVAKAKEESTQILEDGKAQAEQILKEANQSVSEIKKAVEEEMSLIESKKSHALNAENVALKSIEDAEKKLSEIQSKIENNENLLNKQSVINKRISKLKEDEANLNSSIVILTNDENDLKLKKEKSENDIAEKKIELEKVQNRMIGLLDREDRINEYLPVVNEKLTKLGMQTI